MTSKFARAAVRLESASDPCQSSNCHAGQVFYNVGELGRGLSYGFDTSNLPFLESKAYEEQHDNPFFQTGQVLGDLGAMAQGIFESWDGGLKVEAGLALAVLGSESGVGILAGGALAGLGVAEAGHGIFVANQANENLQQDLGVLFSRGEGPASSPLGYPGRKLEPVGEKTDLYAAARDTAKRQGKNSPEAIQARKSAEIEERVSELLTQKGDKIMSYGDGNTRKLLDMPRGVDRTQACDFVSLTEGGKFNPTEVKASDPEGKKGAEVGEAINQLRNTYSSLMQKIPDAKLGEASVAIPEGTGLEVGYTVKGNQLWEEAYENGKMIQKPVKVGGQVVTVKRVPWSS